MEKIKIGVLCPSEIAFRRFMPALKKLDNFQFAGIAAATENEWSGNGSNKVFASEIEKAEKFIEEYGGSLFNGYSDLVSSNVIDAVYIPLPPALHFKWAKKALENGKHILVEKPFTTSLSDTKTLIDLAEKGNLAVHENYMFVYHSQIEYIQRLLKSKEIGEIRLIRIDFGFPFRGADDFRYNKDLGGGALLDCGGYTIKLALLLLGETAEITASHLNYKTGFEVDIYGSATITNSEGLTAQLSFGMDNSYKCSLEIWGSEGTAFTNRILTAPDGFEPVVIIRKGNNEQTIKLSSDDTFKKSIEFFGECVENKKIRENHFVEIINQSKLIERIIKGEEL